MRVSGRWGGGGGQDVDMIIYYSGLKVIGTRHFPEATLSLSTVVATYVQTPWDGSSGAASKHRVESFFSFSYEYVYVYVSLCVVDACDVQNAESCVFWRRERKEHKRHETRGNAERGRRDRERDRRRRRMKPHWPAVLITEAKTDGSIPKRSMKIMKSEEHTRMSWGGKKTHGCDIE